MAKRKKIMIEIPLVKYLEFQQDFFGPSNVYVTKCSRRTYVSDGKPDIYEYEKGQFDIDFECGYMALPAEVTKHLTLEQRKPIRIEDIIKQVKEKESK